MNSSAIDATEDTLSCRPALSGGRDFVLQQPVKAIHSLISDLGDAATQLIGKAIDAWATKDEALAGDLARQDDRIDDLHSRLIQQLLELNDQASVGPAIRLAMVGRYFERIGDHAVNMGERVRYFVTGDEEYLG